MFSGLVNYNPRTENFEPALAKSWSIINDGLSYIFELREGVLWSDGENFDANDVIFTFENILAQIIDEETGNVRALYPSRYYEEFHINGKPIKISKINDYSIRFDLPMPYAPFLHQVGLAILPEHILHASSKDGSFAREWTTKTAIEMPQKIVGLGAFKIFSYKPGERLVLEPNPYYWKCDTSRQRLPYLDYLVIKFVSESKNTSVAHFATGKSDASGIGSQDYEWVKKAQNIYDFTIYNRGPSTNINFLWFNQHPGKSSDGIPYVESHKLAWFTDKFFRKAILHGFNRRGLIDAVFFGKGEPLHSIIPPSRGVWHNPNVIKYEYSVNKARDILKSRGYNWNNDGILIDKNNNIVSFNLLLVENAIYDQIGATFVENMKELGIDVRLEKVDFATLVKRSGDNYDYDMTILGWGSSSSAYDPSGSKSLYLSNGIYHVWHPKQDSPATDWEAKIDELIGLQEQCLELDQRVKYMHAVQEILSDELPLLYGFTPHSFVGIKNKWKNIYIPSSGSILWNIDEIWEDEDE